MCTSGACKDGAKLSGPIADQEPGDCKKNACVDGELASVDDPTDIPHDWSYDPCQEYRCTSYGPSWAAVEDGRPCPGGVCRWGSCGSADDGLPDTTPIPTPLDRTVGKSCADDSDCDVTGSGITRCTNTLFALGTIFPDPICFGTECEPGDGIKPADCDDGRGVCIPVSSGGLCFPRCSFDGSGGSVSGCYGKNICSPWAVLRASVTSDAGADADDAIDSGIDADASTPKVVGIGRCFGGCHSDSDCTKGDKCQIETAFCLKAPVVYTKGIGDPCTKTEALAKTPPCNCRYQSPLEVGYCTAVCKFGDVAWGCPSGFTCDPGLPKRDLTTGETLFEKAPLGIEGECLKNCFNDSDCLALGAYCEETAGTGQKTCQIGKRP